MDLTVLLVQREERVELVQPVVLVEWAQQELLALMEFLGLMEMQSMLGPTSKSSRLLLSPLG